jgi:hypothetical protein
MTGVWQAGVSARLGLHEAKVNGPPYPPHQPPQSGLTPQAGKPRQSPRAHFEAHQP